MPPQDQDVLAVVFPTIRPDARGEALREVKQLALRYAAKRLRESGERYTECAAILLEQMADEGSDDDA